MSKTIVVTGASSGFGAMTARALADAGHLVYAGMRNIDGRNSAAAEDALSYAKDRGVTLQPLEMDVSDEWSVQEAIAEIIDQAGRLDVVVHNAGHMSWVRPRRSPRSR